MNADINLPVIVKPNSEGSSLGIDEHSLCFSYEDAKAKSISLLNQYKPILVEEYIQGYEITVWIIGNKGNYELVQPLIISANGNYYFESRIFTINDKANHIRNYSLPQTVLHTEIVSEIKISQLKYLKY